MIEVLSTDRCTLCDLCVRICPTNVFDTVEGGPPLIARHSDCQTCFQCEAYCPADAIFVSPMRTPLTSDDPMRDESYLVHHDLLGMYRERVGWRKNSSSSPPRKDTETADYHQRPRPSTKAR